MAQRSAEEHLIDLEILITHLDRKVEVLSQVVREQAEQIDRLHRALTRQAAQSSASASMLDSSGDDAAEDSQPENF